MSTTTATRKVPTSGSPAPRTGSYKPPSISKGSKVTATNGSSSPAPSKDAKKVSSKENSSPASKSAPSAPFSAKQAAVKRVNTSDISDLELENAAAMDDLKSKLAASEEKAEAAASDFANQVKALQMRLDEAVSEQSKLEESLHARENKIETLETEVKELSRNKKEQEKILESEREAFISEKEEMVEKEQAMNTIITQLKKALTSKDRPDEEEPMSPSGKSTAEKVDSALLELKEKLVSSLRLELAEAQIRLTEAEQMGAAKVREAEEKLLEARMANARLTEDNESFQLLLGQATMNGDFAKGEFLANYMESTPSSPTPSKMGHSPKGSLAGELEAAVGKDAEDYKKLEAEVKSLKDQNKALTLYINKIIGRLLQSGLESILDKSPEAERERDRNKELPPTPEDRDAAAMPPPMMLTRTRSLAQRKPMNIKPIPIATPGGEGSRQAGRSVSTSTTSRGHRRSHSDAPYSPPAGENDPRNQPGQRQTVVYTANPLQRTGTFPVTPSATTGTTSSSASFSSTENGDIITAATTPSPPHGSNMGPISGKALRPLSLLGQGPPAMKSPPIMSPRKASGGYDMMDDDAAAKKNKRTSWIGGWFNKGGKEDELPSVAEDSIASKLNAMED